MNNNNILQKETVKNLIKQLRERERDGILEKNNLIFIEKLISKADSEEEAIKIAELGTIYKKTGLHFDRKLEISTDSIKVYKKNDKLSFEQGGIHHKLIIGDNYDALMNLLITHRNKIDVIYIDPPYGCDDMGEFAETNYENQITRDNLLSMLEPRLILAKQLLSEDGVIFCSIDDKNYAYLKCLFDEVFGERNFWGTLIRRTRHKGGEDGVNLSTDHEYCLVYSKTHSILFSRKEKTSEAIEKLYGEKDDFFQERGMFYVHSLDAPSLTYTEKLDYPIKGPDGKMIYAGGVDEKGWLARKKDHKLRDWRWPWSENRLKIGIDKGFIFFKKSAGDKYRVYAKHYSLVNLDTLDAPSAPVNIRKTILEEYDNHLGTSLIKSIFNGERVFDFPKPLPFIAELISFLPNKSSVVLDFFGGSGTTGHAVMELNKKDGGNRQFILATLNEKDIAIRVTAERLRRVMTGKTSLGDNDFPWNKNNKPYGDSLDVLNLENISINDKKIFDEIDETLYGVGKKLSVQEKITWVCDNFDKLGKEIK